MELEEMKSLWEKMSARVEKLEVINEQNIMEMTKRHQSFALGREVRCSAIGEESSLGGHKSESSQQSVLYFPDKHQCK